MNNRSRLQSRAAQNSNQKSGWYHGLLARYGYVSVATNNSKKTSLSNSLVTFLVPHDIDSLLRFITILLVGTSFLYASLVNQTVKIVAEYSTIEDDLKSANNRLTAASTAIADSESLLEMLGEDQASFNQVEPAGFVSRDQSSGFTYGVGLDS